MKLLLSTCLLLFAISLNAQKLNFLGDNNTNPSISSPSVMSLTAYTNSGTFYFIEKAAKEMKLYSHNGIEAPKLVKLSEQFNEVYGLISVNDKIFINVSNTYVLIYDETLDSTYRFNQILPLGNNYNSIYKQDGFVKDGNYIIMLSTVKPISNVAQSDIELWKTDGTPGGTSKLSTMVNAPAASSFNKIVPALNSYFVLFDYSNLLYMVNRNTGAVESKNITILSDFKELNGSVYFIGGNNNYDKELWVTKGTSATTNVVLDINSTNTISPEIKLNLADSILYFNIFSPIYGYETWRSNGTAGGTRLVKDLNIGGNNPDNNRIVYKGNLYYSSNGILKFVNITDSNQVNSYSHSAIGSGPSRFFIHNDLLFFTLYEQSAMVICSISQNAIVNRIFRYYDDFNVATNLKFWNNRFYIDLGDKTIVSDGTATGTHFIKYKNKNIITRRSIAINTNLYIFDWSDSTRLIKLSAGDSIGTVLGTFKFKYSSSPNLLILPTRNGSNDFYFLNIVEPSESVIWELKGNTNKPAILYTPKTPLNGGSGTTCFFTKNGFTYFLITANDKTLMYRTDGTISGMQQIAMLTGTSNSKFCSYRDTVYFINKRTLFAIDSNGVLKSIYTHSAKNITDIYSNDTLLFLFTSDQLYLSDGTANGTSLIKTFTTFTSAELYAVFTRGQLFFGRNSELWKSNGTNSGTLLIKSFSTPIGHIMVINNNVLFTGSHMGDTYPFISDGTTAGTNRLSSFNNFIGDVVITEMTKLGNKVCFLAYFDGDERLYITDGTNAGTIMLKNITGNYSNEFDYLTATNNTLYFTALSTLDDAPELWASNGTAAGTTKILETIPGLGTGLLKDFIATDSFLYFTSFHSDYGYELWRTNTNNQSQFFYDILPGPYSSSPQSLYRASNSLLFFNAFSYEHSYELYSLELDKINVEISIDEKCIDEPIRFEAITTGFHPIISYQWLINNILVSDSSSAEVLFSSSANQQIKLIIENSLGVIDSALLTYKNGIKYNVDFSTNDTSQCLAGNRFIFTDQSVVSDTSMVVQRVWKMGDGTTYMDSTILKHTYMQAGIYNIVLHLISGNCNDSITYQIQVMDNASSAIIGSDSVFVMSTTSYSVNASPESTFSWSLQGNGNIISQTDSNTLEVKWGNQIGKATLTVDIVDTNGCIAKRTYDVDILLQNGLNNDHFKSWLLYPNPVADVLHVSFAEQVIESEIQIFNSVGSQLFSQKLINGTQYSIPFNYSPGVYQVRLSEGTNVSYIKLVKIE